MANSVSALETVGDYLSDARTLLQDTVFPYRYDDISLTQSLNVTLMDARGKRPDLFLGDLTKTNFKLSGAFSANTPSDPVPIEAQFRLAILYGMLSHALARDQEDTQDARSEAFQTKFIGKLVSSKV